MLSDLSKLGLVLAFGLALSGAPTQTVGAVPIVCGERAAFREALKSKFKEEARGIGLVATSNVLELYISSSGSRTVLTTAVDGKSCVLATGDSWEGIDLKLTPSANDFRSLPAPARRPRYAVPDPPNVGSPAHGCLLDVALLAQLREIYVIKNHT